MIIWFIILLIFAYLLGSFPLAFLLARKRGVNLTEYGTRQMGAGNLWRTTSWKLGIAVGIFDLGKSILAILIANLVGLNASLQILTGIAAIIGHNWPVFLHFKGGRGVSSAIGVITMLPFTGHVTPWIVVAFVGAGLAALIFLRSTPLPVLVALIATPIASAALRVPVDVTLSLAAMTLIVIIKRLTAPRSDAKVSTGELLFNRLLFDRDIRDKKQWMYQKPEDPRTERDSKP